MKQLTVIGYLGRDAKLQESNGKKVLNFSVAHTEKFKKQDGVVVEKTTWVDCSLWNKENLANYLKQGTQVMVQGSVEAYAYTGKESGELKAALRCTVISLQLLGGVKSSTTNATSTNVKTTAPQTQENEPLMPPTLNTEPIEAIDDLPF